MTVLFVDDEPQVLRALERMLDAADVEWEAEFAESGFAALELMQSDDYEAIVTDMRMPRMDGAELLRKVSEHHPEMIRIVLSGQADKSTVLRAVKPMHQYLSKPCDTEMLKSTISRACAMRDSLNSDALREAVGNLPVLPSLPTVYSQLMDAVQSDDFTLEQVGEIIEQDMAMTVKILQLVNSAAFGLGRQVNSPSQAASMLGLETIKSLTLTAGIFQQYDGHQAGDFSLDALMSHSINVAECARRIGRAENLDTDTINEIYTAGMLHDIGKLILATSDPDGYRQVIREMAEDRTPAWQVERRVFGADHSAVGGYLLNLWGLPQSTIEVVALHHTPDLAKESRFSMLSAVWAANLVCDDAVDQEFLSYQQHLHCKNRLQAWRACRPGQEGDT